MCLIVVGWHVHADYPLLVCANRDEYYARPTAIMAAWPDAPQVYGGRDLEAGGTWLGVTHQGRFAAITNVREPEIHPGKLSRGFLPRDFLLSSASAMLYSEQIEWAAYAGFNLLLSDGNSLVYCSNRTAQPQLLPPGIYGLSNHRLDTPWPKLIQAKQRFSDALIDLPKDSAFFDLLADKTIAADDTLPQTGVPLDWERLLSAVFVQSETYGTRASTVLMQLPEEGFRLHERNFGPHGEALQCSLISTGV